jgi:hypothetical protein
MKKWLFIIPAALLLAAILLLPAEQTQSKSFVVPMPVSATSRILSDLKHWEPWWPGSRVNDTTFKTGDRTFTAGTVMLNGFDAVSKTGDAEILLKLTDVPLSRLETKFTLSSTYRFSANRFSRIIQYLDYLGWKKEFSAFSGYVQDFFADTRKVYGFDIRKSKVPNSPHIALVQEYPEHPSWSEVYGLISEIREYVATQQATVVNDPIMNIVVDEGRFKLMVALATNRVLPSSGRFMLKEMVLGNIMVAEVKGGSDKVRACQEQIRNYVQDHGKASPAIPFLRLVTDRSKVADSTQWITTVNYPVFE